MCPVRFLFTNPISTNLLTWSYPLLPRIFIRVDCFIGCLCAIIARVSCSAFVNSVCPVASLFTRYEKSSATSIFQKLSLWTIVMPLSLYLSFKSERIFLRRIGLTSVRAINSWRDMNLPETKRAASIFFVFSNSTSLSSSSILSFVRCSFDMLIYGEGSFKDLLCCGNSGENG